MPTAPATAQTMDVGDVTTAVAEETPTVVPAMTATAVVEHFPDCSPTAAVAATGPAEGTWRVVYVADDQLWLRDGSPKAVVLAEQSDIYAVKLSADGQLVAFARKLAENSSEVWLVESSGQGQRRLSGEEGIPGLIRFVAFSGDNRLVAFTRSDDPEYTGDLWAATTDGFGARQLVKGEDMLALADSEPGPGHVDFIHIAWVPGTHRLTFIPYLRYQGDYAQAVYDPLLSVNADTGAQSPFLEPGEGGYVTYSPDSTKVAVARPAPIN